MQGGENSSTACKQNLKQCFEALQHVYNSDTIQESRVYAREASESTSSGTDFFYGEVSLMAMYRLLSQFGHASMECFIDLGSGSGKAVHAAALLSSFKRCIGYESVQALHKQAKHASSQLIQLLPEEYLNHTSVEFEQCDFLNKHWPDNTDFVLVHATCYSNRLRQAIEMKLRQEITTTGAIVVLVTQELSAAAVEFDLLRALTMRMGWGNASVHIYRRRETPADITDTQAGKWLKLTAQQLQSEFPAWMSNRARQQYS